MYYILRTNIAPDVIICFEHVAITLVVMGLNVSRGKKQLKKNLFVRRYFFGL